MSNVKSMSLPGLMHPTQISVFTLTCMCSNTTYISKITYVHTLWKLDNMKEVAAGGALEGKVETSSEEAEGKVEGRDGRSRERGRWQRERERERERWQRRQNCRNF